MSAVKERPILFSAPMVRAILDGRKTQTRRVVKQYQKSDCIEPLDGYPGEWSPFKDAERHASIICPYGVPGDRLWVRETWQQIRRGRHAGQLAVVDQPMESIGNLRYAADDFDDTTPPRWRPSIFMPRWASRMTLELTDVRVERLQDITEEDARAEGATFHDGHGVGHSGWRHDYGAVYYTARASFAALWDHLNAKRGYGWKANPWVWALTFKRIGT